MYVPKHFAPASDDWARDFITRVGLGTLVTSDHTGLSALAVSLRFDPQAMTLCGLLAHTPMPGHRADVLVIVQGVDAYVSPTFFPSKTAHQQVVPTWHYEVVHVHGSAQIIDDAVRLQRLGMIASVDSAAEWVGIEITITRIEGKRKLGQDEPEADRWGAIAGLRARDNDRGSHAIADLMMAQEQ